MLDCPAMKSSWAIFSYHWEKVNSEKVLFLMCLYQCANGAGQPLACLAHALHRALD